MTFWFIPAALTKDSEEQAFIHHELCIAADGLPSLAKAQDSDQITAWMRSLHPEMPREQIAVKALYYWILSHEILPGDFAIVADATGKALIIGEITASYSYEKRPQGAFHILPVEWQEHKLPLAQLPGSASVLTRTGVSEITDTELVERLKARIPSLRRRGYRVFKWIAIVTLIGEMFYFWPR